MPLMDEFKEERKAMKNKSLRERLSYFWDYYKWHVIGGIAGAVLAGTFIFQVFFGKDIGFYAVLLNATDLAQAEAYAQRFTEYAGIDTGKYIVTFETDMYIDRYDDIPDPDMITTAEKLMVSVTTGELDVMVSDADSIQYYAYNAYFCDLRNLLTTEQLAMYEPYFFYIDQSEVERLMEATDNFDTSYTVNYLDPMDPEAMEQPVPVGLYVNHDQALQEAFYFRGEDVVLCVCINTTRPEAASKFIDFVMQ